MKKTIRFVSVLMILVLLAGEFLPVYASSSPGHDIDLEDNPFDIRVVTDPSTPPGRKKKKAPGIVSNQSPVSNVQTVTGPVGPGYVGADGQPISIPTDTSKFEDRVVKTVKHANGIIEASTVKPSDGLKYKLIITPYAQYPMIVYAPSRELCSVAFNDVTAAPVLSDYLPIIDRKAVEAGVAPESCYPYQLFDMTYYRDYGDHLERSDNYDSIALSLPDYVLDRFVCLLHYMDGAWYVVENAYVIREKGWLRFSVDSLSPFAIILHDDQSAAAGAPAVKSPQTGYDFGTEVFLAVKEWLTGLFD